MRGEHIVSNGFASDFVGPIVPVVQSFECDLDIVQVTLDRVEIERVGLVDVGLSRSKVMRDRFDCRRCRHLVGVVVDRSLRVRCRL